MTKKEYIDTHEMIGYHAMSAFFGYTVHGIEDDYAYVATWYDGKPISYHRVLIRYDKLDCPYVVISGVRVYLNEFIRLGGVV